ncbi:MAG: porin, partial [Myxococcota bacterium]
LQNEFGTNGGPNFFVHDAWTEFNLVKSSAFRLDFGGGLLYWNGISRMTNASTLNFLAIDAPITNWATINGTDQFARQLGLYVKGDAASKLIDYRIALVRPFSSGRFGATPTDTFGLSWYLKAQFLDKESNTLPYAVGTYLGAKTVFNIGTGGHWQPNAGAPAGTDETGENGDILLLGFDAFADLPLGDKGAAGAVTAYLVGYIFDYGEGDVAPVNTGIMRIPSGGTPTSLNGTGNGYALFGDGFSAYGQVGYLLPGDPDGLRIQPYVTAQLNAWSAYDDIAPVLEVGSNFYLEGHHAKFTLNYRARPIMTANETSFGAFDGFASEFILQTMIFL